VTIDLICKATRGCLLVMVAMSVARGEGDDARPAVETPPNILLVIADDLGYSDIGVYGGEMATPNIDSLSQQGTLFTSFHTSPACATTRAMLFSGVDNHRAGLGTLAEIMTPKQLGEPGYEGYLNHNVTSVARVLQDNGYRTYYSGKWHLGSGDGQLPIARGFDRSFAMLGGGGSHFDDRGFAEKYAVVKYTEDGNKAALPAEHYSSVTFTNKLLEFVNGDNSDSPFFGVLSFTAPHWPLQAPQEAIARHEQTYKAGWDTIRDARFQRMKAIGLIPESLTYPPRSEVVPAWSSLQPEEQQRNARIMAIYAAMVELMDENLGRVLAELKASGELDNTVVIFMSDNGADARDITEYPFYAAWLRDNFETVDPTGDANSFIFAGPGWGQVSTTPHRDAKSSLGEGGIRSPLIFADFRKPREEENRIAAFTTVLDVVPTLLDLIGNGANASRYDTDNTIRPVGRSMLPVIDGEMSAVHAENDSLGFEYSGHSALIQGKWKALRRKQRQGQSIWALYDLETDQTELNDLATVYPERLESMKSAYAQYESDVGVISRD